MAAIFTALRRFAIFLENVLVKGIAKRGVKTAMKGGVSVLFALSTFARVWLAFACVFASAFALRLSAFVCVCLRLLAFAYAPLCYAPPLRDTEKF